MKNSHGLSPSVSVNSIRNHSLLSALLLVFSSSSFAAILPGELIISEVMANPAAVSDSNGEWFELYNPTANAIDLNGLSFYDNGSNSHAISETLVISANSYLLMGRNNDASVNGGVTLDYVYSNFTLGNSSDAIIIEFMGVQITALSYSDNNIFGVAGISAEFLGNNYALSPNSFTFGDGDIGTPGSEGSYSIPASAAVPIPAAGWLMASGLCSLLIAKKRRR